MKPCHGNSIPCCEGCCCTCRSDFPLPCECHGPKVEAFHGDLIDADGNVVGTVGPIVWQTPWGEIESVKVPTEEIVFDPDKTFRVDLSRGPHDI